MLCIEASLNVSRIQWTEESNLVYHLLNLGNNCLGKSDFVKLCIFFLVSVGLNLICLLSTMSTTTASDVRKTLATDAACSKQHRTTCLKTRHTSYTEVVALDWINKGFYITCIHQEAQFC